MTIQEWINQYALKREVHSKDKIDWVIVDTTRHIRTYDTFKALKQALLDSKLPAAVFIKVSQHPVSPESYDIYEFKKGYLK